MELTALVNMKPITTLHVIQFPSGKFGYAGRVPTDIGFIDATPELIAAGKSFGERFGPKARRFDSAEEAKAFATSNGYEVA
jgi:hypothetical protein